MKAVLILFFLLSYTIVCITGSRFQYPIFKQCDPRWANEKMGVPGSTGRATVCLEGCAMSSVAMALAGRGFLLPNNTKITPGTLNEYLVRSNGYVCSGDGICNNLALDAPNNFTHGKFRLVGEWGGTCCGGENAKPSEEFLKTQMLSNQIENIDINMNNNVFVAHVRNGTHFVLLTGYDDGKFLVNDPYYNATSYTYSSMSDIIVYSIVPAEKTAIVPFAYPLYKQSDYRWGKDLIVSKTVGQVGCLMSSTAMALAKNGIEIPETKKSLKVTPGSLNQWLKSNGGYTKENNFVESSLQKLDPSHIAWTNSSMHKTNDLSINSIMSLLREGQPVIANVMQGEHFVLVIGVDAHARKDPLLYVNDPGFFRIAYNFSDVVGWRLFKIT